MVINQVVLDFAAAAIAKHFDVRRDLRLRGGGFFNHGTLTRRSRVEDQGVAVRMSAYRELAVGLIFKEILLGDFLNDGRLLVTART